ncbi:hypothetical protein VPMG_00051 [Vibrio phage VBP32]|uniref:Uncharacterized protein n=2 Tax=Stoningtonvirus VBP47 TaxID=2846606 RepID=M4SQP9_9CAUD|nr:hypothetical protein VPNG_00077 [Vibrio phage VBP47]YP_007676541.1 hypothetical protein VPMG_00051 [Vibrio phage VBP32]AGH57101.1 hypothetical protein VPNG_00077 [Vibrio phage VBP47]AGH57190.1 hypothetical protein VPMG_00051 [Vibrio phage VBP32]
MFIPEIGDPSLEDWAQEQARSNGKFVLRVLHYMKYQSEGHRKLWYVQLATIVEGYMSVQ